MTSYTSQSASGYNTSPPADDGSATEANKVKWSTIKSKLGDPVKDLADAINTQVSAAFGRVIGNEIAPKTSDYTATTTDEGKIISCTNTITVTAPVASTAGSGFVFGVINTGSGVVTIDGNASETINGKTTVDLRSSAAILICDGANWTALHCSRGGVFVTDTLYLTLEGAEAVFDLTALTYQTAESVGPTGAGADHPWTALDNLPDGIDWIKVGIYVDAYASGLSAASTPSFKLCGGPNGASVTDNARQNLAFVMSNVNSTGVAAGATSVQRTLKVNSSKEIKLLYERKSSAAFTSLTASMYLVGYGWNT